MQERAEQQWENSGREEIENTTELETEGAKERELQSSQA